MLIIYWVIDVEIKDLPNNCEALKEALYGIVTYEKFTTDNFRYYIRDFDYQWVFTNANMLVELIIPKNVGKLTHAFLSLKKHEVDLLEGFMDEIKKLNIVISGLDNDRAKLYTFIFSNQLHFYDFYILCKKYNVFL